MSNASVCTGRCLCGAVSFTASAPPRRVTHCHCTMCRRASGAVAGTFASFATDHVQWRGEITRYRSSEVAWRGFCAACGSSVCFGFLPRPERTYVAIGIFDRPDEFPAGFHDYPEAKISWLHLDDSLPNAADFKPR